MLSTLCNRTRCAGVIWLFVVIVGQLCWRVRALCTFGPSSESGRFASDIEGKLRVSCVEGKLRGRRDPRELGLREVRELRGLRELRE